MTFEAQAAAVERAVEVAGGSNPELRARIDAARDGASTSGEYYDGVKGAFNDALRRGRLSREAEAALREAVRAIDEIFRSSHPGFYAGRAGDWARLVVFGLVAGAIWSWLASQARSDGAWLAIDFALGVAAMLAYRVAARRFGARLRSAILVALLWSAVVTAIQLVADAPWRIIATNFLAASLACVAGAWLYDKSGGLRW